MRDPATSDHAAPPDREKATGQPSLITAKQARELGLKWARTIRSEARQHPSRAFWVVNELIEYDSGQQGWRYFRDRPGFGRDRQTVQFADESKASAAAGRMNREREEKRARDESDRLKKQKAADSSQRRSGEEVLMRAAAIARHNDTPRVEEADIIGSFHSPKHRDEVVAATREMPYLRTVYCRAWPPRLYVSDDGATWRGDFTETPVSGDAPAPDKAREVGRRAQVAEGYGFAARAHWGHTKAAIRKILKPRANELLEMAGVRRLLDEALAEGRKALVWDGIVFWYEEAELRWEVRSVSKHSESRRGDALWLEGTILSTNHGRIIVLPYIKEDGSKVRGHTKNGPHDEPALPRHPSQYVEIPFSRLDGDTMIGTHGELPYE